MGWVGLTWVDLGMHGFAWVGLGSHGFAWVRMGSHGFAWVGLTWVRMGWVDSNWLEGWDMESKSRLTSCKNLVQFEKPRAKTSCKKIKTSCKNKKPRAKTKNLVQFDGCHGVCQKHFFLNTYCKEAWEYEVDLVQYLKIQILHEVCLWEIKFGVWSLKFERDLVQFVQCVKLKKWQKVKKMKLVWWWMLRFGFEEYGLGYLWMWVLWWTDILLMSYKILKKGGVRCFGTLKMCVLENQSSKPIS